jgi:hypothetical protein
MIKSILIITILISSSLLVVPISTAVYAASPQLFPSSVNKALSVKWWQWLLSIPPDNNPILDDHPCNVKQSGPFFYLVGSFGGSAERQCTIPTGKSIFFPIVNVVVTLDKNDPTSDTIPKIKKIASDFINQATDLKASVDGVSIKNTGTLRAQPPAFKLKVPDQNLFGAPAGTYVAVSDGFWVALKPLSVGQHTIHFGAEIPSNNFKVDVTYHITVQ